MHISRIVMLVAALTLSYASAQTELGQALKTIWKWEQNLDEVVSEIENDAKAFEQLNKALTGLPEGERFDPTVLPDGWEPLGAQLLAISDRVANSPLLPTVNIDQYAVDFSELIDCRRQDKAMKTLEQLDADLQVAVRIGVQRISTFDETRATLMRMDAVLDNLETASKRLSGVYSAVDKTTFNRYAKSWLAIATEVRPSLSHSLNNIDQVRKRIDRDLDNLRQRSKFLSENLKTIRDTSCTISVTFKAFCKIDYYKVTVPARVSFNEDSIITETDPFNILKRDGKLGRTSMYGKSSKLNIRRNGEFSAMDPEGPLFGHFGTPDFDGFNYTAEFDKGGTVYCFSYNLSGDLPKEVIQ